MKPGRKNKEAAYLVLNMIEYYQKCNTSEGITALAGTKDFNVDFETFYDVIFDMKGTFKDEFEILNIYDHVNKEHWMNPPRPGDKEHRPIAELRITGPIGKLRTLVEAEYKDLDSNTIEIIIDKKTGLYIKSQPERFYKLQYKTKNTITKRFRLIKKLNEVKGTVSGPKLRGALGYDTVSLVGQEIKKINKCCREQADLFDDLIVHQNTGGYNINSRYSISFK